MPRELVFLHGRAQQRKNPDALKKEWVDDLTAGLAKSGLPPIDSARIRFPYYGDTLDQLARGTAADDAVEVVLRGDGPEDDSAKAFLFAVVTELQERYGISDEQVSDQGEITVTERGPLNWPWVRAALQTLDRVDKLSAFAVARATLDVHQYLTNRVVRTKIDRGVQTAMTAGAESIVVAHSLGTVVAYTLLLREGENNNWKVPTFITLGSPLAVNVIRGLAPGIGGVGGNRTPSCVGSWYNAMDPDDAVALHPLDTSHFPINPPTPRIENKTDVVNDTDNQHGISGYLGDPVVARRIFEALDG